MKIKHLFLLAGVMISCSSCKPEGFKAIILADGNVFTLITTKYIPLEILAEAGLSLGSADKLLQLGAVIPADAALPSSLDDITLVIRRGMNLTVTIQDGGEISLLTSAETVGEALMEAGYTLNKADHLDPPATARVSPDMLVVWQPSISITLQADGFSSPARTVASPVGQALARLGFPIIGLDASVPREEDQLGTNLQINLVRVIERISLSSKSLPYGTRTELSADLEIDQQDLIQEGEDGLALSRIRTREADGVQVLQVSEPDVVVRPPEDQVLGIGTRIVIKTATVDGVTIEYWRALTLFATYYKPCIPGTTICHYGTASGTRVRKGAVAMVYPWYLLFAGEKLYIPGYGYAIVEDNNGAWTNAFGDTYWIDLGYSETDAIDWFNQYVTVYFLTPVPANLADTYLLP